MKKISKVISVLLATVMSVSCLALVGCGNNSEEVIRTAITEEFDGYKNQDDAVVAEIVDSLSGSGIDSLGIDSAEFVNIILDGFDYTVDQVTVDGETASAQVTITSKDFSNIESDFAEITSDIVQNANKYIDLTEDELTSLVSEKALEVMRAAPITTKDQITINYTLDGDTWTPDAESEEAISSVILGSLSS